MYEIPVDYPVGVTKYYWNACYGELVDTIADWGCSEKCTFNLLADKYGQHPPTSWLCLCKSTRTMAQITFRAHSHRTSIYKTPLVHNNNPPPPRRVHFLSRELLWKYSKNFRCSKFKQTTLWAKAAPLISLLPLNFLLLCFGPVHFFWWGTLTLLRLLLSLRGRNQAGFGKVIEKWMFPVEEDQRGKQTNLRHWT